MIINDFFNKIKGKFNIDTFTIMCLVIIIGVGLGSFGLGRLSVISRENRDQDQILITEREPSSPMSVQNKAYVASRSGKLYYPVGCLAAKRISVKNQIWFSNYKEAEEAGYLFSESCR